MFWTSQKATTRRTDLQWVALPWPLIPWTHPLCLPAFYSLGEGWNVTELCHTAVGDF